MPKLIDQICQNGQSYTLNGQTDFLVLIINLLQVATRYQTAKGIIPEALNR